ncbi:cold-shock protein [Paenibacillus sp. S-38]|uniref:cold-shock protein n=1 Tax=Paenibacillus sp. S-38 TaxID=3416710 RepID=UPI003CF0B7A7
MYFSKRTMEPAPQEETPVWTCSKDGCNSWMRDNFAFEEQPYCPLCSSVMVQNTKMLPVLVNHFTNAKK